MATVRTSPSLDALVPSWTRHLRAANLSPRTVQSYGEAARRLGAFLDERLLGHAPGRGLHPRPPGLVLLCSI